MLNFVLFCIWISQPVSICQLVTVPFQRPCKLRMPFGCDRPEEQQPPPAPRISPAWRISLPCRSGGSSIKSAAARAA